jgi:hypothetical protein
VEKSAISPLISELAQYIEVEDRMPLEKTYVRGGRNEILGNVTSGFHGGISAVVRDKDNRVVGYTSDTFHTTRRTDGSLVSVDTADPALLIPKK